MPQCQRYNEYEVDPINTNFVELKIGYNFDLGFKLEINIDVKHTVILWLEHLLRPVKTSMRILLLMREMVEIFLNLW